MMVFLKWDKLKSALSVMARLNQKGKVSLPLVFLILVVLVASGFLAFRFLLTPQTGGGMSLPMVGQLGKTPEPPTTAVSVYKGFWSPVLFLDESWQSLTDEKLLKELGVNTMSFGPTVKINARGETMFSGPFGTIEDVEERLAQLAKRYYQAGIRISLAIETFYEAEFTPRGGGEPKPFPQEVVSQPGFFDQYNQVVEEMAQLAEKYQVEIFIPMNEPDYKFGQKIASDWGQVILPRVKKHYQGKVLFKATYLGKPIDINFKGYDVIGVDITPGGGPPANFLAE